MNRLFFSAVTCLTILLLSSGCTIHQPAIPFHYNQKISAALYPPPELETRLLDYWTFRSMSLLQEAYEIEAPYIRELTPFSSYAKIFSDADAIEKLEILDIKAVSNYFYEITLKLYLRKGNDRLHETVLIDRWVNTHDTWFHVIIDPVFKNYFP